MTAAFLDAAEREKSMKYIVGFDIGGTKISVSLAAVPSEGTLQIKRTVRFPTPPGRPQPALEQMEAAFGQIVGQAGLSRQEITGIGISCGGPLDSEKGLILSPPNLMGWDHVPITAYFQQKLGVPAFLQNDADACALAEWKFGAGKGAQNMIFLTFGTGFGAGLILNGALYPGSSNSAGEIGHCLSPLLDTPCYSPVGYGKAHSFEGFCSGGGIADLARTMLTERFQRGLSCSFCEGPQDLASLNAKTIGEAAEAGDPVALEIFRLSGRHLGAALSVLIDLLNPQVIVIGSIFARREGLLRDVAWQVVEQETLPIARKTCRLLPAQLGEELGDVAAISIALNALQTPN